MGGAGGYRATLRNSVRVPGRDDPRILTTRHELAWTIANQDRLGEAREAFGAVLTDRVRLLGPEHPQTLATRHELAWVAARQGEWAAAEADYRSLLDLRLRLLGEDHPNTILTRHEVAWIAARQGRAAEAEAGYAAVLDRCRRVLGRTSQQGSRRTGTTGSSGHAARLAALLRSACRRWLGRPAGRAAGEQPHGSGADLHRTPARNGIDYATLPAAPTLPEGTAYTVGCGLINPGMGVLPAALISRPGTVRGTHPLNSFAALGPLAGMLISAQSPTDVYGPIRELAVHEGVILLIGAGLNRMTALHLAEQQSGRRLFLRWARGADGRVSMVEVGSCSEGFPRLEPALHPYARTVVVGGSQWRAYPARQTLAAATAAITADQGITRCPDSDCLLCCDSIAGGPIEPLHQPAKQDGTNGARPICSPPVAERP